jgi:hypothetical protein
MHDSYHHFHNDSGHLDLVESAESNELRDVHIVSGHSIGGNGVRQICALAVASSEDSLVKEARRRESGECVNGDFRAQHDE